MATSIREVRENLLRLLDKIPEIPNVAYSNKESITKIISTNKKQTEDKEKS